MAAPKPTTPAPKPTTPATLPATGFVRLPLILTLLPMGKSAWWAGVKSGRYPKSYKLGARMTAWKAEDIAALIAGLGA